MEFAAIVVMKKEFVGKHLWRAIVIRKNDTKSMHNDVICVQTLVFFQNFFLIIRIND